MAYKITLYIEEIPESALPYRNIGPISRREGDMLMNRIVREAEAFGVKPPKYQPERW